MGVEATGTQFWKIEDQLYKFDDLKELDALQSIWKYIDYDKFIHNPINYVQELFGEKGSMFPPLPTNVWETRVLQALHFKHFERRSQSADLPSIPSLNDITTDRIKNGQVVTFRCIVQDCLGPEMCPSEVSGVNPATGEVISKSTLLQDVVELDVKDCKPLNGQDAVTERELLIGVSPPGESAWVAGTLPEVQTGFAANEKRMKMDVDDGTNLISLPNYVELFPQLFKNVGEAKPMVALLKIYDGNLNLKPNDLIEVAGVFELEDASNPCDKNAFPYDEVGSNFYPNSYKLPKLYVFSCLKLADGNPSLPMIDEKIFPTCTIADINVAECAQSLRDVLALALANDRFAAVYAMIALVSRVIHREDSGYGPIGKLVLNISAVPETSEVPELFRYILKSLVPRTLPLDFTIDNVNSWKLTPMKNMDTNQLETGMFQMASGTHLLINETRLKEGNFEAAGAHNVSVLRELLHSQQVKYDYTFQFPQMPANTPIIVLSDTPSVLPVDVRINLKPDVKLTLEERRSRIEQILAEKGTVLRKYLSLARTILKPSHPVFAEQSLNEDFETFFRSRNQTDAFNSKMTPSQFSAFITSCRLWALLSGELSITRNVFIFWKDLERIRDSRLAAGPGEPEKME